MPTTTELYAASHEIADAGLNRTVAEMILTAQANADDTFADCDVDAETWEAKADEALQIIVGERSTPTAVRAWFVAQGFSF